MSDNNTSIWTVDVFVLLDRLLAEMGGARPRLTTTVIGCNPMYVDTEFYTENFLGDEVRVTRLFKQIKDENLDVQEMQISTSELTALLSSGDVLLIVLVDATLIPHTKNRFTRFFHSCLSCLTRLACLSPRRTLRTAYHPPPVSSTFQGHYLLATGYNPRKRTVSIIDPSGVAAVNINLDEFEHARSAFGTDNDVISIYVGG
eukprot:TRINITY_DN42796_c0_g1_i1.p1 TRINITY_DN42796_c0_g1~~TRINITY_DN42796_c0_g1_i1.p1  ORF type:complete len:214 (+),score=16.81 TRINITY_DN42796_c0_g1_i1:37-642(+)